MSRITSGNLLTANRLCENDRSAMSRPWTRATELQSRKVYKLLFCIFFMTNGLLKKLALAGMVGVSAMFGAKEAKAAPVNWSSFSEVVGSIPEGYYQNYTSSNSSSLPNQCSGILYFVDSELGSIAIGGFDLSNGQVTQSYFGDVGEAYVVNTGAGANPNYFWEVYYDSNGDGILGTQEGGFVYNRGEKLDLSQYDISGFSPFGSQNPGSFTFNYVPEPSTSTLLSVGASALALPNGTNVIHFKVAVTNLASFRLECRDSLTNATWTSLGTFSATGAVTEVSDTNTAPARFYRAVSP